MTDIDKEVLGVLEEYRQSTINKYLIPKYENLIALVKEMLLLNNAGMLDMEDIERFKNELETNNNFLYQVHFGVLESYKKYLIKCITKEDNKEKIEKKEEVMNNLKLKDTLTSLELVEQINIFRREEGKDPKLQHKDLLKIIRLEFEDEIGQGKISPTSYIDKWNREQPMYILTLEQAKQVLVRESRFVRKAVILYIGKLEEKLKNKYLVPTNYSEALKLAYEQSLQIENLEKEIVELKPAKEYLDFILASEDTMTITQIAADYGITGNKLNNILHEKRIIRKVNKQWILYADQMNKGYTKSKTINPIENKIVVQTMWTQKGRLLIHNILTDLGHTAIMDKK